MIKVIQLCDGFGYFFLAIISQFIAATKGAHQIKIHHAIIGGSKKVDSYMIYKIIILVLI